MTELTEGQKAILFFVGLLYGGGGVMALTKSVITFLRIAEVIK